MNPIEKIKEKVLEEHFGTNDLSWINKCPKDEITKECLLDCVEKAIKLTAKEIFKEVDGFKRDKQGILVYYDTYGNLYINRRFWRKLKRSFGIKVKGET